MAPMSPNGSIVRLHKRAGRGESGEVETGVGKLVTMQFLKLFCSEQTDKRGISGGLLVKKKEYIVVDTHFHCLGF